MYSPVRAVSANASLYDVWCSGVKVASDLTGLVYTDGSVTGGVSYTYQVAAKNGVGSTA